MIEIFDKLISKIINSFKGKYKLSYKECIIWERIQEKAIRGLHIYKSNNGNVFYPSMHPDLTQEEFDLIYKIHTHVFPENHGMFPFSMTSSEADYTLYNCIKKYVR